MKVWKWYYQEPFLNLVSDQDRGKIIDGFNGVKMEGWDPLEVKRVNLELPMNDCTGFSPGVPIFNGKIIQVLGDMLDNNVQLLPIINEDPYFG